MAIREILLLGNSKLYEHSKEVIFEELAGLKTVIEDLHDTLIDFQVRHGYGRAIAAPQIGVMKRLIYVYIDHPVVIINPELCFKNNSVVEIWDDCMSFPGLMVKVPRYKKCHVEFRDYRWKQMFMELEGDLSELMQHEFDHLNGILAVSKAINNKAFAIRPAVLEEA